MINAAARGALSLEKLEAMTCVCSVGLDMIAVPEDTPASTIAAIIADEAAIGMVNSKTTAVRIIPRRAKRSATRWNSAVCSDARPSCASAPIRRKNLLPEADAFPLRSRA